MASPDDKLLTTQQVADKFGVTPRTIRKWRERGLLTQVWITGHAIYYRNSDVLRLIEQSSRLNIK